MEMWSGWWWWRENNGNVVVVVVEENNWNVMFVVVVLTWKQSWCWWGENNRNVVLLVVVALKQWKCGVGGENNENKVLVVVKKWKQWKCGVISWRGSRIDADRFSKRAPRAQASKGVPGEYTPGKLFWFNPLKSPFVGFWVIQTYSDRILASSNLLRWSIATWKD